MTAKTTTKLIDLINQAKAVTPLSDPKDIAAWVLGELQTADYKDALAQCLPGYVANMTSMQRNRTRIGATTGGRSRAQEAADHWRGALEDLYQGIDGNGKAIWKRLYEMNYDDLIHAATKRFSVAEANVAKANQILELAEVVKSHGVDCVGALPDTIKAEMLTPVVAS